MTRGGVEALKEQPLGEGDAPYDLGRAHEIWLVVYGAVESTCRQYQGRFKRPAPLWSQTGDEALRCLETYCRSARWYSPSQLHQELTCVLAEPSHVLPVFRYFLAQVIQ